MIRTGAPQYGSARAVVPHAIGRWSSEVIVAIAPQGAGRAQFAPTPAGHASRSPELPLLVGGTFRVPHLLGSDSQRPTVRLASNARAEAYKRESVADRFSRLTESWRESRTLLPLSASRMAMHPAYQEIIGMGRDALPLILFELERKVDHWFWALRSITGIDPVRPEHRGDLNAMAADWIRWGSNQGIL